MAIFELIEMDEGMQKLLASGADGAALRAHATADGDVDTTEGRDATSLPMAPRRSRELQRVFKNA